MGAEVLIGAKKELRKLQNGLGKELAKGKYKDSIRIKELRKLIKGKKLEIGGITRDMIAAQ